MAVLTWKKFQPHFQNLFLQLHKVQNFADVTLVSEDYIKFQAHKVVLSSASSVFRNLFEEVHSEIYLCGVNGHEIESLLQFVYLGRTELSSQRFNEFMDLAKCLGINMDSMLETLKTPQIVTNLMIKAKQTIMTECPTKKSGNTKEAQKVVNKPPKSGNSSNSRMGIPHQTNSSAKNLNTENIKEEIYRCKDCDFTSLKRFKLKFHIEAKHDGVKYTCNECEYSSINKHTVIAHKKSKHEVKIFPCTICSYIGQFKADLRIHTDAIHNGVRYTCDECQLPLTSLPSLKRHKRRKHRESIFTCEKCFFEGATEDILEKHECRM